MFRLVMRTLAAASLFLVGLAPAHAAPARQSGSLTLWHAWTGAEQEALQAAVGAFASNNPSIQVNLLQVPFDQLKNKFTVEASTGGGPDLLIGPKDWIGELAQAHLIQAMDDVSPDILASLNPAAVQANAFGGKVWAVPESTEAMALFYNTSKVASPPTNVDEMLAMAPDVGLAINSGFYQYVGFIFASGGRLFDENQKVVLNEGGTTGALSWLRDARSRPGVTVDSDGSKLDALFKDGRVGMIFNGPWATGDYAKALGKQNVAVAPPIRVGETASSTFAPFLGTKNVFLSANSSNQAAALAFIAYLVSPEVQTTMAETAGHIPANPAASLTDPILQGFLLQTQSATYFPNEPEMGAVWTPASDMITKVVEGKATPEQAVTEATDTINRANKKT